MLTVVWAIAVYLPDRQRLDRSGARRAELVGEIKGLWYENTRLSKGERALREADPYLWQQVIRMRLKGMGTPPVTADEEIGSDVR